MKANGVKSTAPGTIAGWIARYEPGLLVVATPLLLFPGRWTPLGLAIILLAWLGRGVATGRLTVPTGLELPIGLLTLMTLVGYAVSADAAYSQAGVWRVVLGIAWFYGVANLSPGAASLCRLGWLWITAAAGLLLLVIGATDWQNTRLLPLAIYDLIPQFGLYTRLGSLGNARGMGMALAMVTPVLLALALLGRGRAQRLTALLVAMLMLTTLVLTQSLQGAIGLVAAVALLLVLWSPWTLLAAIPLAAVAVWAASRIDWPALVLTALDINNAAGIGVVLRLDIWNQALAMMRDLPLTGIGLDSYPVIQTHFYSGHLLGPEPHAHNLLMQITLDTGLPGLLAFLWLLLAFAVVLARALRSRPEPAIRALLAGAAAGVVSALAAGSIDSIWTFKWVVFFWLLLGTGVVAARAAVGETVSIPWRWQAAAGGVVVLVLAVVLLRPGTWQKNLGLLQAHQAVVAARTSGTPNADRLRQARAQLLAAQAYTPGHAQLYDEIGSLDAWLGDEPAAWAALRQRVVLDAADALARYAPWEVWRRQIAGEGSQNPTDDALRIYGQWMIRYPDRAEGYVRVALTWETLKKDPARAAAVLQDGLSRGAQPQELLVYGLAYLGEANTP